MKLAARSCTGYPGRDLGVATDLLEQVARIDRERISDRYQRSQREVCLAVFHLLPQTPVDPDFLADLLNRDSQRRADSTNIPGDPPTDLLLTGNSPPGRHMRTLGARIR